MNLVCISPKILSEGSAAPQTVQMCSETNEEPSLPPLGHIKLCHPATQGDTDLPHLQALIQHSPPASWSKGFWQGISCVKCKNGSALGSKM